MGLIDVRSWEWISIAYFAALTATAWLRPLPAARRLQITAIGLPICGAILWLSRSPAGVVHDWAPAAIILAGYYASGRFFVRPSAALERWLMAWDHRLLGNPATRFARWPRLLLAYFELVYMGCFLLVPAGFAVLVATGRTALGDRYWTMVVAAELGAFASLGIAQARPPWALEHRASLPDRAVHRLASRFVRDFTINVNTFPSGHVAGSLAVAFALIGPVPWAGASALVLALSISVACIVGRYHYAVDGVAGAALAVTIWVLVRTFGL